MGGYDFRTLPPSTRALIYCLHTFWNLFRPGHTTRIGGQIESALAKSNVLQRSIPWHVHAHNLGYWKKCFTRTPGLRRNLFTTHWKKIAPQKHHVGILTSWLCDLSWFFTHIFFTHVMFSHFIFHDVRYTARKLKSLRFMAEHSTTQLTANYARLKYIYIYITSHHHINKTGTSQISWAYTTSHHHIKENTSQISSAFHTQRFWVTSHLTSLMDTESMVCSFRRMLRGVSDGDLMLSEDLRGSVRCGLGATQGVFAVESDGKWWIKEIGNEVTSWSSHISPIQMRMCHDVGDTWGLCYHLFGTARPQPSPIRMGHSPHYHWIGSLPPSP